jgi:hypothetical protein
MADPWSGEIAPLTPLQLFYPPASNGVTFRRTERHNKENPVWLRVISDDYLSSGG